MCNGLMVPSWRSIDLLFDRDSLIAILRPAGTPAKESGWLPRNYSIASCWPRTTPDRWTTTAPEPSGRTPTGANLVPRSAVTTAERCRRADLAVEQHAVVDVIMTFTKRVPM